MRNFKFTYVVYENDFPIYTCESLDILADYFKITPKSMRWKTSDYSKRFPKETKVYSYRDEISGLLDCSQKCFANSHIEIYRFWSE